MLQRLTLEVCLFIVGLALAAPLIGKAGHLLEEVAASLPFG